MRTLRRIDVVFIVAVIVVFPEAECQNQNGTPPPIHDVSFERPNQGTRLEAESTEMSRVRTKGMCRDGWTHGTMRDVSGQDIPICLKINAHAQSWEEAKSTCRKDYGFLMKLDSIATWEDNELLSVLFNEGITKTWTGVHSERGHLIWDDLVPSQLKPHDYRIQSGRSVRPWRWDSNFVPRRSSYCGYVDINEDSTDRRRRSSDDDNTDGVQTFDSVQDSMYDSRYRRPMTMLGYPRTAAFQSGLTRTQISSDLPVLESSLQIPGTGLSDTNTQDGGLSATLQPTFESVTQRDNEESKDGTSSAGAGENVEHPSDPINAASDDEQIGLEKLREQFKENQNIQSDSPTVNFGPKMDKSVIDKTEDSDFFNKPTPPEVTSDVDNGVTIEDTLNVQKDVQQETPDVVADTPLEAVEKQPSGFDDLLSALGSLNEQPQDNLDILTAERNDVNSVNSLPDALDDTFNNVNPLPDVMDNAVDNVNFLPSGTENTVDSINSLLNVINNAVDDIKYTPDVIDNANDHVNSLSDVIDNAIDNANSPPDIIDNAIDNDKSLPDSIDKAIDNENSLPDVGSNVMENGIDSSKSLADVMDNVKDMVDDTKVSNVIPSNLYSRTNFNGNKGTHELMDPEASHNIDTFSKVTDTLKDMVDDSKDIYDDSEQINSGLSDATRTPPVIVPVLPSLSPMHNFDKGLIPENSDSELNDKLDMSDDISTDKDRQVIKEHAVPIITPPFDEENNEFDTLNDETKDIEETIKSNNVMLTNPERENDDMTTHAWTPTTTFPDDKRESTMPFDYAKQKDDGDDDITDMNEGTPSHTHEDSFKMFTETPFFNNEKSDIDDVLEDFSQSTIPPVEEETKKEDDLTDHDLDSRSGTYDDIFDDSDDHFTKFSNGSDETQADDEYDKSETSLHMVTPNGVIDSTKEFYEKFIEDIKEQSNNPVEDRIKEPSEELDELEDDDQPASLIESVLDTVDRIKDGSDLDTYDDNTPNELDVGENTPYDENKDLDDKLKSYVSSENDSDRYSDDHEESISDKHDDTPEIEVKEVDYNDDDKNRNVSNQDYNDVGDEKSDDERDFNDTDIDYDNVRESSKQNKELYDENENINDIDDIGDIYEDHREAEEKGSDSKFEDDWKDNDNRKDEIERGSEKPFENEDDHDDDAVENIAEINDDMKDPTSLEEIVTQGKTRVSLQLPHHEADMVISSCEIRLPSVCFSYEVKVMSRASTCDNGWYGHVLLDTCFKVTNHKMTYRQAVFTCESLGSRVVIGDSEFQRKFVLLAVQKEGILHRGEKFWKESPVQGSSCRYFSEREANVETSCNAAHRVVCIKDAKTLSVRDSLGDDMNVPGNEAKLELSSHESRTALECDLTNTASEFPVLWFKDGALVKTMDKYVTDDVSLRLDDNLVGAISSVTNRNITMPVLQGKYWCEVWDRKSLTRVRSRGYDVRFKDVISFHGSMELLGFNPKQEMLFNMVNERFESLARTELDIQRVFRDVLPRLQRYLPDVRSVDTYADKVRSNPSVIEYHTYFTLSRDYTVEDEDLVYSRLKGLLRSQLGNIRYMASLEGGTPISSFRTMSLQSTVSCPAASLQTTRDLFGKRIPETTFSFKKVLLGEFANSLNNCSERSRLPAGTARCLGDFHTGAYWSDVVANECVDETNLDDVNEEIWGTSPFSQKLVQMSETPVSKKNVEDVIQEMTHITDAAVHFTPSDINKIADILDHSTQIPNLSKKVGENVLKTVNKLLAMEERETHMANLETKAANRILQSVERFADNLNLDKQENMRLVSDNVVVEIWDLKSTSRPVIGLAAQSAVKAKKEDPFQTENIATVFNSSQLYDIDVDAAIELPKEVFTQQEKGESLSNRLTMVVYRKSKLFDAAVRREGQGSNPRDDHFENLNSFIISASIAGKKIVGLTDKVRTIFKPLKESDNSRKCVWWDFTENNFKGGWSSLGCQYDGKMNGRDVCLCDHLTNFAVLLDFYGQSKPIEDHHELSLSIITMIGLSLSILGLSLTIISYVFFRKLRQGRAQQTLFNLSLALLFSMMVFLIGIKQTHNHYICLVVAVLLHYFILVSFMWMLMEAMLQYLTFVKILGTYIERFTIKTVLPAWGLPIIPVVAVLSVDYNLYKGGPDYCWMSLPAFYYAFTIPISLIILINVIIFFITVISIFRRGKGLRSNQKKQKIAMTNLQAAFTSFILLGLTWIFGYLAISDARITFQYIFTILNSLQGFFIFVLFVVRKKKVRDQWYIICCKGSEKSRVSRSLSASNSIPSSCSGSRNRRTKGGERDRSDSTKTVQSTYSNSSIGYTNYGYETGFDQPFNRGDKRFFRQF